MATLVGTTDADYLRWHVKHREVSRLSQVLGDRKRLLRPSDDQVAVAELSALIGSQNDLIQTWQTRLTRVRHIRSRLILLDNPQIAVDRQA